MKQLFNHPYVNLPLRIVARTAIGAQIGIALSEGANLDTKLAFIGLLSIIIGVCSPAFYSFDQGKPSLARMALYGLLMAGEGLGMGAVVLAALGPIQGRSYGLAVTLAGVGASVLILYALVTLYRDNANMKKDDNIPENPGSDD